MAHLVHGIDFVFVYWNKESENFGGLTTYRFVKYRHICLTRDREKKNQNEKSHHGAYSEHKE